MSLPPFPDLQYSCVDTGLLSCVTRCQIENEDISLNLCFKYHPHNSAILPSVSENNSIKLDPELLMTLGLLTYIGVIFMAKPIKFACKKVMNLLKNPEPEKEDKCLSLC